jgi:hypothetical protein
LRSFTARDFCQTQKLYILKLTHLKLSNFKKRYVDVTVSVIIASFIIVGYQTSLPNNRKPIAKQGLTNMPTYLFGYNIDSVFVEKDHVVKKNDVFGDILEDNGLTTNHLLLLEHEAKDIFDVRNIQVGSKYHVIKKHECDKTPMAIIYEPNKMKYVVYDFTDSVNVRLVNKKIDLCEHSVTRIITVECIRRTRR